MVEFIFTEVGVVLIAFPKLLVPIYKVLPLFKTKVLAPPTVISAFTCIAAALFTVKVVLTVIVLLTVKIAEEVLLTVIKLKVGAVVPAPLIACATAPLKFTVLPALE